MSTNAGHNAIQQSHEPVRVLHLTDPHLFADSDSSLRGIVTHSSFCRVLAHIEQCAWPADLISVTGDLIQDDSRAAYDRFCELMRPLGLPVYCIPGNHDVRALMRDALRASPFHYCASIERHNWLIAGIDSCIAGEAGGCIVADEMRRLDHVLASTSAEHVLICLHHPPLPVGSSWLDQVGLRNGDELLRLLADNGKVRATIFGHVHQQFDQVHGDIRIVGTPSTCRQFKICSDEFALDDNPPAYRRIELHPGGDVQSELIWVGDE